MKLRHAFVWSFVPLLLAAACGNDEIVSRGTEGGSAGAATGGAASGGEGGDGGDGGAAACDEPSLSESECRARLCKPLMGYRYDKDNDCQAAESQYFGCQEAGCGQVPVKVSDTNGDLWYFEDFCFPEGWEYIASGGVAGGVCSGGAGGGPQ